MGTAKGTALLALAAVARGAMAGSAVRVRVERLLAVTPPAARDAWLSYQWSGGGGLPVVAVRLSEDRRLVAPLLLEETLDAADGESSLGLLWNVRVSESQYQSPQSRFEKSSADMFPSVSSLCSA